MLKMDLEYANETLFIFLEGSLVFKTTYKIYNYLIPILQKQQIKKVVYNLKKLKRIDSSGRDAILMTKEVIDNYKGEIYFQ